MRTKEGVSVKTKTKKWILGVFLVGLFAAVYGNAETIEAQVLRIVDGDTVHIVFEGSAEIVRLYGIDAPELKQEGGKESRKALAGMIEGKTINVKVEDRDRYGRLVGDISTACGRRVSVDMAILGHGWWYRKYAAHDVVLQEAENQARRRGVGLWASGTAIPPWEYRAKKKRKPLPDGATVYRSYTTKVYHRATCRNVGKKRAPCAKRFAEARGYEACKVCAP